MKIYKLKYATQEVAEADLILKGIIKEQSLQNAEGVHGVVYVGKLVDQPAVMVDGVITTEATFLSDYHVDIATDNVYIFEEGIEQAPTNPKHKFWV